MCPRCTRAAMSGGPHRSPRVPSKQCSAESLRSMKGVEESRLVAIVGLVVPPSSSSMRWWYHFFFVWLIGLVSGATRVGKLRSPCWVVFEGFCFASTTNQESAQKPAAAGILESRARAPAFSRAFMSSISRERVARGLQAKTYGKKPRPSVPSGFQVSHWRRQV